MTTEGLAGVPKLKELSISNEGLDIWHTFAWTSHCEWSQWVTGLKMSVVIVRLRADVEGGRGEVMPRLLR